MAIDYGSLPTVAEEDVQVFTSMGATNIWTPWSKPKNCGLVGIFALGAGAGGGGGFTDLAGSARSGGGGGGSGAFACGIWLAEMLPGMLYVSVGVGGTSGPAATVGGAGSRSFVAFAPDGGAVPTIPILQSGAADAVGGPAGTPGLILGGAGSTVTNEAVIDFIGSSIGFNAGAGQIGGGSDGGVAAPGVSVTWGSSGIVVSGGAGGGPVAGVAAQAGGGQIGAGLMQSLSGGAATGAPGPQGITFLFKPFMSLGGAGGGGLDAGVGGTGGNGGIGSGGAGGGGGTTGGAGGRGGDGRVLIVAF